MSKIIVVDDDAGLRADFEESLAGRGHQSSRANGDERALAQIDAEVPCCWSAVTIPVPASFPTPWTIRLSPWSPYP